MTYRSAYIVSLDLSYEDSFSAAQAALSELKAKTKVVDRTSGLIEASMGLSIKSNGEKITLNIKPSPFLDGHHVFIESKCSWFTATNDWGKNMQNVLGLSEIIHSLPINENNSISKKTIICSQCKSQRYTASFSCKNCGHILVPSGMSFQSIYGKDLHLSIRTRKVIIYLSDLIASTYNVRIDDLFPFVINEAMKAQSEVVKFNEYFFPYKKIDLGIIDFLGEYCYRFAQRMFLVCLLIGHEFKKGRITKDYAVKLIPLFNVFYSCLAFYWMDLCVTDNLLSRSAGMDLYLKSEKDLLNSALSCFERGCNSSNKLALPEVPKDINPFLVALSLFIVS